MKRQLQSCFSPGDVDLGIQTLLANTVSDLGALAEKMKFDYAKDLLKNNLYILMA